MLGEKIMNKGILLDVSEEMEGIYYTRIRSLGKLIKTRSNGVKL